MKCIRVFILLCMTNLVSSLQAQEAQVAVAVSRDTILFGNAFYVQYSFNDQVSQMSISELQNADILAQNLMRSTSIIQGKIKSVHQYRFLIQPSQTGPFVIPGSAIIIENHEYGNIVIPDVHVFVITNPQHLEIEPEDDSSWQLNEIKPGLSGSKRKSKKL